MPRSAPTLDATYFRHGARDRAFAQVVRVRLLAAPVLAAVALTFAFFEPTFWRRALLAGVVCMLLTVSVIEWLRYRRLGLRAFMLPLNLIAMSAGQACIALATGGLFSPVIPALFLVVVLGAVLAERGAILAMIALVQIPATWAMAVAHVSSAPVETLVPELFGGAGALEDGPAPWIAATVYTAMFVASARIGAYVRGIFEELFTEAMQERDRSLALHAEQNRALTQLSGEIAHELKNPLASVKGLASLVAKELEGKPAERMAVLRREVDRMQGILEEFLNFSRPLVPLALSEVDLARVARDVARQHEGMTAERGVSLVVEGAEAAWLRCDPRKVHQVLINLVQNALDASPRGGSVRVVIEGDEGEVRARVIDEGAGLDPEVADRVFEAGVTTKEHGSGLGLAVARSLARQHGGELALRGEGGCEATLTLPRRPPEAA